MNDEFGPSYSAVLLADYALTSLAGQTADQAIAAGVDPREVWLALCLAMDVPKATRRPKIYSKICSNSASLLTTEQLRAIFNRFGDTRLNVGCPT